HWSTTAAADDVNKVLLLLQVGAVPVRQQPSPASPGASSAGLLTSHSAGHRTGAPSIIDNSPGERALSSITTTNNTLLKPQLALGRATATSSHGPPGAPRSLISLGPVPLFRIQSVRP